MSSLTVCLFTVYFTTWVSLSSKGTKPKIPLQSLKILVFHFLLKMSLGFLWVFLVRHLQCIVIQTQNAPRFSKGELNPKIDFSSFEHLGIVEQLYEVFLRLNLVRQAVQKNLMILINMIWSAAPYEMSAVVYDVGYDTTMIKMRKNMVTVRILAAIKEKQLHKTYSRWPKNIKVSKHIAIFKLWTYYVIPYRWQSH